MPDPPIGRRVHQSPLDRRFGLRQPPPVLDRSLGDARAEPTPWPPEDVPDGQRTESGIFPSAYRQLLMKWIKSAIACGGIWASKPSGIKETPVDLKFSISLR